MHLETAKKGSVAMALPQARTYTEYDYYSLPENTRAELIEGQLYYQAAPSRAHQEILNFLNTELNIYVRSKGGDCRIYPAPFAVKLHPDKHTIVEPDITVICNHSKLTDQGCTGAPDWIIEIVSPGNPSNDYIRKLYLYADAWVKEYWIVDPRSETIFVYYLAQENFKPKAYSFQDTVTANLFGDLQINFSQLTKLLH